MDPYKELGINQGASQEEIKSAYRTMVKKYHPDRYSGTEFEEIAKEKMQKVNQAYDMLTKNNNNTYGQSAGTAGGQRTNGGQNAGYGFNNSYYYRPNNTRYTSGYNGRQNECGMCELCTALMCFDALCRCI